jgi:hypothetical protein
MNQEWLTEKKKMTDALVALGHPAELADEIAKNLGSPKAMARMTAYLQYVKPAKVELVVDEMLAICSDIQAWRDKKLSEEANASYNVILNEGL